MVQTAALVMGTYWMLKRYTKYTNQLVFIIIMQWILSTNYRNNYDCEEFLFSAA